MIAIIDYGLGNLGSVKNALKKLGVNSTVTSRADEILDADGIILPGVGAAQTGMINLKEKGLDKIIINAISAGKPFLGICLGMQLLFTASEEGDVACLDIVKGRVKKFTSAEKIPQIGWNRVNMKPETRNMKHLLKKIPHNNYFYFVNSYFCDPKNKSVIFATTDYGQLFASVIEVKNIYGVQFHPEKSGENGLRLLQNFTDIVYENTTSN